MPEPRTTMRAERRALGTARTGLDRRARWGLVAAVLAAGGAAPLPLRAAASDPALAECEAQRDRGEREAADACYRALLDSASLLRRAEAYWGLGQLGEANEAFRGALREEPESARVRARWGALFLETHQDADAAALFREALSRDPELLGARIGLARALSESERAEAHQMVREIVEQAPESAEAQLLLAELELGAGALDRAEAALRAAGIEEQACSGVALRWLSLRAGLALLRDADPDPWRERALACNPRYGELDATVARYLENRRYYTEAVERLERAVELDPQLWSAHARLASNLMRVNRVQDARDHLEAAYEGDPFRSETVNLLRLLDTLDGFQRVTFAAGDPRQPELQLHLAESESEILAPYIRRLTRRAIEVFGERFAFELREPVSIEFYPNHDDFAVRIAGIPGIGLLGVTFGYVVAMDSPSSRRPDEEFFWGSVLWHELAHVFTLEATGHAVPRWFSEGVSVYEEWHSGPAPQRMLPEGFLEAVREGQLLPVTELDDGFQRPSDPGQVGRSYLQAGLLCEWIAERWGSEGLRELLYAFGRELETGEAVREVLEIEPEELDAQLLEHVRGRAAARLAGEPWQAQRRRAQLALEQGDASAAASAARRAIEIEPEDVGAGSAYLLLARAQRAQGDAEAARASVQRYYERGGRDPAALRELASARAERGEREGAIEVLESLRYVDPFDEGLHLELGELLLEAERPEQAREEFEIALALGPHDTTPASFGIARAELSLGRADVAREQLLDLLERTPRFRPAQRLLLQLSRVGGDAE